MPNPGLTGTCAWDTKNDTFGGGVSAKVKTAPTITNQYGRTCNGPFFKVGTTKKENVSVGLTVDAWNNTATQTMTGITISADCGDAEFNAITCPDITVKDPDAMCEYSPSWCGGLAIEKVEALVTVGATGNSGGNINVSSGNNDNGKIGRCLYVTTVDMLANIKDAGLRINGTLFMAGQQGCGRTDWGQSACSGFLPENADNGYYVFFPAQNTVDGKGGFWEAQNVYMTNPSGSLNANCR